MPQREDPAERSHREESEGSREDVNAAVNEGSATNSPMERGSGQVSQPDKPLPRPTGKPGGTGGQSGQHPANDQQDTGGITNRPLDEEQQQEEKLPPRGETKGRD